MAISRYSARVRIRSFLNASVQSSHTVRRHSSILKYVPARSLHPYSYFFKQDYATDGLRTLCIASRDVSEQEYQQWVSVYNEAATTINGRGEALDKAAELIENNLFMLGATAIEDKLQDGVPDTIHTLQMAGIKVSAIRFRGFSLSYSLAISRSGYSRVTGKRLLSTSGCPADLFLSP